MKKETKKCEVCGKELPLSDFSKSYKNRCRKCVADMVRSERKEKNKRKDEDVIQPPLRFEMEIRDMSEDFEVLRSVTGATKVIDWEKRRYELAKDFTSTLLGRLNYDPFTAHLNCCCSDGEPVKPYSNIARIAVSVADALIAELKKTKEEELK